MHIAIWWIRRDLRLEDNLALFEAQRKGDAVLPLFILDPALIDSRDACPLRTAFLYSGLHALAASLRQHGCSLVLRRGRPLQVLADLASELRPLCDSLSLHAEEDFTSYAHRRDEEIARSGQIPFHICSSPTLFHPLQLLKKTAPYTSSLRLLGNGRAC